MKLKKADLLNIGCILSAIPTILFMSWYKWYFAVPGVLLIIMALISVVKMNKISEACCVNISAKTLTAIVIFSVFIVAFSGVGGLFPQSGDNIARNPIFRDLIVKKWPVLYPQMNTGLAYYIGFWLLPALIAKMFGGSFMVGNICLIIVAAIYLTVTALIIISCVEIRHWKMQLLVPLILIIFGGINFIGAIGAYSLADKKDIIISGLGEQYSSISGATYIGNFVAIRQTFNHFLPTLLMVCLYVYMRNKKTYLFQTALLFISSPFSVLSLALTMLIDATISICKEITTQNESFTLRTYGKTIRELFSVPNLCAIPVLLLLLPYFYGTVDGRGVKIVRNTKWFIFGAKSNILLCIVVIFAECGLLLLLLRNQCKHELLYWIAGIGLLVLPFFRFEGNSELELKFTATWLIILMLLLISKYQEALNKSDIIRVICLNSYIVLCIIVFLFEISGTLRVVCVYKSGYGEMKATIESYDNIRISSNKLFASNYTRRNPMNDFFFSILSKADFSEFGKFDIILSQDASTISQIVFTKDNIHYASEISGISAEQLINRAKDMGGGVYCFDLADLDVNIKKVTDVWGGKIEGVILSDDAECNLTARIKSYAKGEFVHIVFKNTSNAILFPYEYTKKDVGIKYAFYDMQGELADDIVSKTIDCIILPNEEVNLTIPVTINTPHKEGNYLLKMWIYEDDEDGSVLLEKKIKVSRRI